MGKITVLILLFCNVAFSAGGGGETDIVERLINFLIFVAILYYLIADKAKAFFNDRKKGIADELEKVQTKLRDSKKERDEAEQAVEQSKKIAEDLIATAKKEAYLISQKVEEGSKHEIENIVKQYEDLAELLRKKSQKEITKDVLEELMSSEALSIDKSGYGNIVLKRVA